MASCPITSWQIDGETMEAVRDFIFLGSEITADVDCSHEIKGHLLLGKKALTNLDNILKSRDIALLTKIHIVEAMVFPVVMDGYESWTIKKVEHQRFDAFELSRSPPLPASALNAPTFTQGENLDDLPHEWLKLQL